MSGGVRREYEVGTTAGGEQRGDVFPAVESSNDAVFRAKVMKKMRFAYQSYERIAVGQVQQYVKS